jgi:hypothetical protein
MTRSKQSKADLMYIAGVMLILCAIPIGVEMGFLVHHDDKNWHWAIIAGIAMTLAIGFIGGLFFCIANIILKRRRKMKKERIHDDVA